MGAPLADGKRETRVKTARQGKVRRGLIPKAHTHGQERFGMKFQSCRVCRNGTINDPVSSRCGHQEPAESEPVPDPSFIEILESAE